MDQIVLAAPILPEKVEAWRRFCQEIMGRRRGQYETSRRALCIVREAAWLAPTPHGSMAIIALNATDIEETWQRLGRSERPFDRWFRRRVLEIHGLDLSRPLHDHSGEAAFQWHSSHAEEVNLFMKTDNKRKGFSHVNLATTDLDQTREFYEGVLGFPMIAGGLYEIAEGGRLRHAYFDIGDGQLLSFIEPGGIDGVHDTFETDINSGLDVPDVFYHFAFEAGSREALAAKREELIEKGVEVTEIVDHDWCDSIYFHDPVNGLTLEYACYTRELTDEDAELAVRFEIPIAAMRTMTQP